MSRNRKRRGSGPCAQRSLYSAPGLSVSLRSLTHSVALSGSHGLPGSQDSNYRAYSSHCKSLWTHIKTYVKGALRASLTTQSLAAEKTLTKESDVKQNGIWLLKKVGSWNAVGLWRLTWSETVCGWAIRVHKHPPEQ